MTAPTFAAYLTEAVGRHKPLLSVATSAILAIISFFYIYTLGSYFEVQVSVLHNFFNYGFPFHLYVFGEYIDLLVIAFGTFVWFALSIRQRTAKFAVTAIYGGLTVIAVLTGLDTILDILALLSVPLLILTLVWNRFSPKMRILKKDVDTDLSTNYIIIAGLVICGASLTSLALFLVTSAPTPRIYAYEIFVLLSSFFSPIFMAILVFCIPVKLLLDPFIARYATKKNSSNNNQKGRINKESRTCPISRSKIIFYLSLFMLLSATMTFIPHQPEVNKDNRPIGQDVSLYARAIKHFSSYSNNPQELMRHAFVKEPPFYGDRPLSLLMLLALVKIVPSVDPVYVIDYIPIILGPALVLAVYFLTREMTSNDTTSILAAFMTAVSFQVLVGMYSTLYANWFALIFACFSFVFLFKFLKRPSKLNLITYSILVILSLVSHVYTGAMITAVTILFLLVMLKFNYYRRRNIILLLLVVSSPVIIDAVRTLVTGSSSGISSIIQFASLGPGRTIPQAPYVNQTVLPQLSFQFASFGANLLDSTEHFEGGLFGNFIILVLCLYWLFRADRREPYNIFIMIFLSIAIVPLFFSNWILQTRVFYNIPFQIPASIALSYIIKEYQMKGMMILFTVCLWLISISFVLLANFYPVIPKIFER